MAERCSETRADGQPCTAWATRTGLCAGHAGLGKLDAKQAGAVSAAKRRETVANRRKTPADLAAETLQEHAQSLLDAAVTQGKQGDINAIRWLYERVLGKPTERIETASESVDLGAATPEQRAELRRRLVAEHPGISELVPKGDVTSSPVSRLQAVKQEDLA